MAVFSTRSPIHSDIDDIVSKPRDYKPHFLHGTVLHTDAGDYDEADGVMIAANSIDRDYVGGMADIIEITLLIAPGTFVYDIYPYADNLELTLTRVKQERNGLEAFKFEETYKAIYLADKNSNAPTQANGPRETMNKVGPITIILQLVDKGSLAVRNTPTQGAYSSDISEENKDMSAFSIMKSVFSTISAKLKVDNRPVIDKVSIEEVDNKDPVQAMIIPTGTLAMDLPILMQEEKGGVYAAGAGSYIQHYAEGPGSKVERVAFVYSLYDGSKFEKTEGKIMFFVSPDESRNMVDCTYKYESRVLRVLTKPIKGLNSTKQAVFRDGGEGFRSGAANAIMDSPLEMTDEGPKYKKTTFLTEMTDKKQEDGMDFLPYKGVSDNHFVNTTDILSRKGEYVVLIVDALDPDYIYPGAPCQISYDIGSGIVREIFGVIHKAKFAFDYTNFDYNEQILKKLHGLVSIAYITVYITDVEN